LIFLTRPEAPELAMVEEKIGPPKRKLTDIAVQIDVHDLPLAVR